MRLDINNITAEKYHPGRLQAENQFLTGFVKYIIVLLSAFIWTFLVCAISKASDLLYFIYSSPSFRQFVYSYCLMLPSLSEEPLQIHCNNCLILRCTPSS